MCAAMNSNKIRRLQRRRMCRLVRVLHSVFRQTRVVEMKQKHSDWIVGRLNMMEVTQFHFESQPFKL
jgi:hypothetical protein